MNSEQFCTKTAHRVAGYLEQELSTSKVRVRRGEHFRFARVVDSFNIMTLWLLINPAYTTKIMGMDKQISQAAMLEKGAFCRIVWSGLGMIELQFPKPEFLCASPTLAHLPIFEGTRMAVGLDNINRAAVVDFSKPLQTHGLVASPTGSGKSNTLRLLAYLLAMQNTPEELNFLMIDVSEDCSTWEGFEGLSHLNGEIINDPQTAIDGMDWLVEEMIRRARQGTNGYPRIVAFVDEFKRLSTDPRFVRSCMDIAERGRRQKINLVLSTQRATGSAELIANCGVRFVGPVATSQEAAWATGRAGTNAHLLKRPGDTLVIRGGDQVRVAIPLITAEDIARLTHNGNGHGRIVQFPTLQKEQAPESRVGRPREPLDMSHMAVALAAPNISGRGLMEACGIGTGRAKRVIAEALKLRKELQGWGCELVRRDGRRVYRLWPGK